MNIVICLQEIFIEYNSDKEDQTTFHLFDNKLSACVVTSIDPMKWTHVPDLHGSEAEWHNAFQCFLLLGHFALYLQFMFLTMFCILSVNPFWSDWDFVMFMNENERLFTNVFERNESCFKLRLL
jgi:hypothetical protein